MHTLERIREEADLSKQEKTRTEQLYFIGGLIFVVVSLISILRRLGVIDVTTPLVFVVVAVFTAVTYFTSRRRITNAANLRARRGFFLALVCGTAYLGVASIHGEEITTTLAVLMFLFAGCTAVGTAILHRSTIVSSAIFFAVGSALLMAPDSRPIVLPLGVFLAFAALIYASRRAANDETAHDDATQGARTAK